MDDEHKALYVLQHWEEMPGCGYKLVPEHVEIRSLYNPENPGLVQVRCVSLSNLDFSLARTFGVAGPQLLGWSPVVPLSLHCGTSPMLCPFLGGQLELCACPALLWKEDCCPCVFLFRSTLGVLVELLDLSSLMLWSQCWWPRVLPDSSGHTATPMRILCGWQGIWSAMVGGSVLAFPCLFLCFSPCHCSFVPLKTPCSTPLSSSCSPKPPSP